MKISVRDGWVAAEERIPGARVEVRRYADKHWAVRFRRVMQKGEKLSGAQYTDKRRRILETRIGMSREAMIAVQDCILTIMEMDGKGAEVGTVMRNG